MIFGEDNEEKGEQRSKENQRTKRDGGYWSVVCWRGRSGESEGEREASAAARNGGAGERWWSGCQGSEGDGEQGMGVVWRELGRERARVGHW